MKNILKYFILFLLLSCGNNKTVIKDNDSKNFELKPKFLSDSIYVFKLLEELQSDAYRYNTHSYRWTGSKQEIKQFTDLFTKYGINKKDGKKHLFSIELSTRYEDPITYWILNEVQKDVETEILSLYNETYNVGVGTLPYWELNAKTYNFLNSKDKSLIVMNSGIFSFSHEMLKIMLETINLNDVDSDTLSRDKILSIMENFSYALEDFSHNRRIRSRLDINPEKAQDLAEMVAAMEFFALAHEYGHIFFNHEPIKTGSLNLRNEDSASQNPKGFKIHDWRQEIEADIFAFNLMNQYISKKYVLKKNKPHLYKILRYMPVIFFHLSDIAAKSKYIYIDNTEIPENQSADTFLHEALTIIEDILVHKKDILINTTLKVNVGGKTPDINSSISFSNHPPDNIRSLYMQNLISSSFNDDDGSELGQRLDNNIIQLWGNLEEILNKIITKGR